MIRFALGAVFAILTTSVHAEIDIQEVTSPGGIEAWLVEEESIPFVAIEIIFDGGATLDDPAKRGATNLMMALLEEGSGDLDARTFQTQREGLAASFGFDTYDDSVSVSAVFLTESQDEAMALLRNALVAPRFDEDAVERVRAQVLSIIRSDATNPNRIASAAFDAAAFGDHPYGTTINGSEETVAALTRDDLVAAHLNAMTTQRVYVAH